jgi:hypothetical protein
MCVRIIAKTIRLLYAISIVDNLGETSAIVLNKTYSAA